MDWIAIVHDRFLLICGSPLQWSLIIATLIKTGLHLPALSLQAFDTPNLHFTIGGYVRILAVMTGIEVFANLVAAYSGRPAQKSQKAILAPGPCTALFRQDLFQPLDGDVQICAIFLPGIISQRVEQQVDLVTL